MKLFGTVDAHCDVPCGIYETNTMKTAAETCRVMCERIARLGDLSEPEHLNSFVRMVATKEKHAEEVKHQVTIIWGDYFKPEHLEKFPDLHDMAWQILKQASTVKQGLAIGEADKLIDMVGAFAECFADSKK